MSHNTFGHLFRVTTFGESHGPAIGCVVDGCPPGIALSEADIQRDLDRRRPGQSRFTTQRQEPDQVRILSGVMAHPTGELVRVVVDAPVRLRDADPVQHVDRVLARDGLGNVVVDPVRLDDLVADGVERVHRRQRILEDHGHLLAALELVGQALGGHDHAVDRREVHDEVAHGQETHGDPS